MSSPQSSPPVLFTPEQFYAVQSPPAQLTSPTVTNEQLLAVVIPESTSSSSHPSQSQQQPPLPQSQQQSPLQHTQAQQPKGPRQRQPRYQWDVARTRLAMQELLKYVTEHGFPKTSHGTTHTHHTSTRIVCLWKTCVVSTKSAHPYDGIAAIINGHGVPANNRQCDGRTVETKWETLKKLTYVSCNLSCLLCHVM